MRGRTASAGGAQKRRRISVAISGDVSAAVPARGPVLQARGKSSRDRSARSLSSIAQAVDDVMSLDNDTSDDRSSNGIDQCVKSVQSPHQRLCHTEDSTRNRAKPAEKSKQNAMYCRRGRLRQFYETTTGETGPEAEASRQ